MQSSSHAPRRTFFVTALLLATVGATAGHSTRQGATRPPVRHVFVIVLENEPFARTFGPQSPAPYLADTLVARGAFLRNYYGIGHSSLDNYIAMVSGQAPNVATQRDCTRFVEFELARPQLDTNGQAIGSGCVYPAKVKMVGDQIEAAGLTWRGYMEDLGNDSTKERAACGHPAVGAIDSTTNRERGDQYATKHNPFYYFRSLIDHRARCSAHVVNLRKLATDLRTVATTPNYAFITPNLCDDGHDAPCVDGDPGGLVQADRFLRQWVPLITQSPAFRANGVLIITFDEAGGPPGQDSSACCGERGLPGGPLPGGDGPGGGRVGAIVLSPFVRPGTVSDEPYNHYAMLRWVERVFGLGYLGYARDRALGTFGKDVFGEGRSH
jgi:hypothetical protein